MAPLGAVLAVLMWQQFENTEWEREVADFNNTDVEVPASLTLDAVRADTKKLYTFQAFESGVSEGNESLKSFVNRRRAFLLLEK
jgi:hypothetical protein